MNKTKSNITPTAYYQFIHDGESNQGSTCMPTYTGTAYYTDTENIQKDLDSKTESEFLKSKIEGLPVKVFVKIGENGKLFGKINSKQIATEFKKQNGYELDKRKIQLKSNISSLGSYKVEVKLHKDVTAIIDIQVIEE